MNKLQYYSTVSVKRRYDSRLRQEQARQTRRAVLEAAGRLFVESGYAATPVTAVAAAAGVSVQTVYAAFGSKRQLLSELLDVTIAGDDEPVPLAQRPFVARIQATDEPREKLARYAEHLVETHRRLAGVMLALAGAATTDADVAAIWHKNREEAGRGMTMFGQDLMATGCVRSELTLEEVAQVLQLAMDVRNYDWLVGQCGWSEDRFRAWYVESVASVLLEPVERSPQGGGTPSRLRGR